MRSLVNHVIHGIFNAFESIKEILRCSSGPIRNINLKITSGRNDMEDDPYVSKVEKRRLGPVLNSVTQMLLIDSLFSNV